MMELNGLIERLEAGSGADRQLDVDLFLASQPANAWQQRGDEWAVNRHGSPLTPVWERDHPARCAPRYTRSLDAALAFAEAVLPGWTWACDATAPECGIDWECFAPECGSSSFKGTSSSHARAVLLATLKALVCNASEPEYATPCNTLDEPEP